MSNSVGHSLLQSTVLNPQSQRNSSTCIAGNTLFQAQATSQIRKSSSLGLTSILSSDFRGRRLTVRKSGSQTKPLVSGVVQAVLVTDPTSELGDKYILGGDIEMQVDVKLSSIPVVEIQLTNSNDNLYLHWGGLKNINEKWVLPGRRPEGTKVYKDRALRTPFVKSGPNSFVKVEIDDPSIQALEFLIVDEGKNKWYKNNGQNFHVKLRSREKQVSNVVVPEDLVQIQAFLRWEKKGKQMYTPEQEKMEYEAARAELYEEIARGSSLEDLRTRLTKKDSTNSKQITDVSKGNTQTKVQKAHGEKNLLQSKYSEEEKGPHATSQQTYSSFYKV